MRRAPHKLAAIVAISGVFAVGGALASGKDGPSGKGHGGSAFHAKLTGYQEVPAVSTTGRGRFTARVEGNEIHWQLRYRSLEAPVQQAHIHFAQPDVNGGVSAFLCSNLPEAPADVQDCPAAPARISGAIGAEQVVGPAEQGIEPGELDELLRAMRAGMTYVNVHTDAFPNGEIRGQVHRHRH
jgi:CHRD domain